GRFRPREVRGTRVRGDVADGECLLECAIEMLTEDAELRAMHLLATRAPLARPTGCDRIDDDLAPQPLAGDAIADGVDDAGTVGAEDRGQRSLRQTAGDEHVEVVQRARAKPNAYLSPRRLRLGAFGDAQRRRTVEANELKRAHPPRRVLNCDDATAVSRRTLFQVGDDTGVRSAMTLSGFLAAQRERGWRTWAVAVGGL